MIEYMIYRLKNILTSMEKGRAGLLVLSCLLCVVSHAQTTREITISQDEPYIDHLSLKNDVKDMDLMVKFIFDEKNNQLQVNLISYRSLFVFWDDVRYKNVVRWGNIVTDRLPYVAEKPAGDRFRLSTDYRAMLPKPRRTYIFRRWIEYNGLQPVPAPLNLVNEYIQQTFDIQGKRDHVVVRLKDILLMDPVKKTVEGTKWQISYGRDLKAEYQITIRRNPCFGQEKEVDIARQTYETVRKTYCPFRKQYGKGTVASEAEYKGFLKMKTTLLEQFHPYTDSVACSEIQAWNDAYNLTVDSIAKTNVRVVIAETADGARGGNGRGGEGSVEGSANSTAMKAVLMGARQLDAAVSRWLVSKDRIERKNLVSQCENIIKTTDNVIKNSRNPVGEGNNALRLYQRAKQYYKRTCQ